MNSTEIKPLTKRESEVVKELMCGGRISTIAVKFGLSQHTVRNHLRRIFAKMKVNSQAKLIKLVTDNPVILNGSRIT